MNNPFYPRPIKHTCNEFLEFGEEECQACIEEEYYDVYGSEKERYDDESYFQEPILDRFKNLVKKEDT